MRLSIGLAIVFCCLCLLAAAPPAQAFDCDECTACNSCSQVCQVCSRYGQDGCLEWRNSTCGQRGPDCEGCCPNYVQTGYEAVGTYGNGEMFSCSHHTVYKVTMTDQNNCETPNYYQYCDDVADGGKSGFFPDCCDGYGCCGLPDPLFTCNGWHSCF